MLDRNAFRIIFSIIWVGSVTYDVIYQPRLGHEWYIYKLIMLTNLNFVSYFYVSVLINWYLQLLVTVYSVLVALSCIDSLKSLLKPVTDFMFYTSVFPVGIVSCLWSFPLISLQVTCALFWGLYVIDPALVMPAWIAKLIPQWLNHVTHTLPVFYLLFEIYSTHREAPTKTTSMIMSSLLVAIYFAM